MSMSVSTHNAIADGASELVYVLGSRGDDIPLAIEAATASRDPTRLDDAVGEEPKISQWRKLAKPKRRGKKDPVVDDHGDCTDLSFAAFFMKRKLMSKLEYVGSFSQSSVDIPSRIAQGFNLIGGYWHYWKYTGAAVIESDDWEQRLHGTWIYSIWSTLHTGIT